MASSSICDVIAQRGSVISATEVSYVSCADLLAQPHIFINGTSLASHWRRPYIFVLFGDMPMHSHHTSRIKSVFLDKRRVRIYIYLSMGVVCKSVSFAMPQDLFDRTREQYRETKFALSPCRLRTMRIIEDTHSVSELV